MVSLTTTQMVIETPDHRGLLDKAQTGDTEAFCQLCRQYETGLLRQAVTLCGNVTLAEDLTQETLIEAWKSLHRYNGRCRFFTWLCAILLNRYRNTLRQKRFFAFWGHSEPEEPVNPMDQLADTQAWPDQAVQEQEQAALVQKCIQALPRKHQQVIHLRFYVDDSLEGIAAALGCSVGTVKSRLFHALEKLRKMKDLSGTSAPLELKVGRL